MSKEDKKPKSLKDISPFNINSLLVKQAGLTSKYSGGDSYTGYGEVDIDKMMDPMKDLLLGKMNSEEDTGTGTTGPAGPKGEKGDKGEKGEKGDSGTGGTSTSGDDPETEGKKKEEEGKKKETDPDDPFGCKENPKNDQCPCKCPPKTPEYGNDGLPLGVDMDERDFLGYDSVYIDGECNCYRDEDGTETENNTGDEPGGTGDEPGAKTDKTEENKEKKPEEKKEEKKEEPPEDDLVFGPGFEGFVDQSGKPISNRKIKKHFTPAEGTETAIKNADGYNISLPSDVDTIQKTRFGLGDISDTDFIYDKKGGKINTMISTGEINGKEYSAGINNITYGQDGQVSGVQLSITLPSLNSEHKKHPLNNDQPISLNQYRSLVREQYQTYQKTVSKLDKITKGNIPLWCYTRDSKRKPNSACEGMDESLRFTKKDYQAMQLERAQFFKQAKMLGVELSPLSYRSPLNQREKQPVTQEDKLIIGPPYSDEYLISRGVDPKVYRQLVAEQKKEKPVSPRKKKKSPFERRERSYLNVRKKWMPTSSPMMQIEQPGIEQPSMEQPSMEQPQQNQENIFDKMKMYGDGVREKVDKFVANARYNSQVDKPIKAINNQEWVGKITEFLKQKKGELVEAKKNKDKQQEQKIFEHVNTLINDVTNYAGKFESWRDRNGGDKTPGNMGGNMTSEGSMKDKRFEADLAFIGDTNTDLGITEEGKIGIKSYGLNDLKYVEDLDQGVFTKDFAGYKKFLDMSKNIQENAESGRPKNQNIINGQADLLLQNKDSLLSWAHDPLYGQAWIQDYAQGNPDEDLSWAMPESDQFDKDRLEDEVHGWLTDKLSQAYDKYAPKKDLEDVDKIQQETMSSIGEENYSKQTPMQYKTKAQQLIEKYS